MPKIVYGSTRFEPGSSYSRVRCSTLAPLRYYVDVFKRQLHFDKVSLNGRQYTTLSVANVIATALVSSRLDYCNSLFHSFAFNDNIILQNSLARVMTKSQRFFSICVHKPMTHHLTSCTNARASSQSRRAPLQPTYYGAITGYLRELP